MKQFYFSFLLMFITTLCLNAQARQYVLFEHFTQASCGPCADQNPAFQDNILANNRGNVHHIAYHTSWPGTDPMNAANPQPVQNRVDYYGVTGVPDMYMNGEGKGGPAGVSETDVANLNGQTPVVSLKVTETEGTDRTVTIEVITNESISGEYTLRTAVIERMVEYASPPGSNGERDFPNVFRETLNGFGEDFTLAPQGESVSFEFNYTLDEDWHEEEVYVIAYVQDNSTKTVLNSGSSDDPAHAFTTNDTRFKSAASQSEATVFTSQFYTGDGGFYTLNLISDQPDDWTAEVDLAGQVSSGSMDVLTSPDEVFDILLNVTPSITPGVGKYVVELTPVGNSIYAPQRVGFNVISNVWDLVVTNEAGFGDGTEYGPFDVLYKEGLEATGNKYVATMGTNAFMDGINAGAMGDVKNVYYNVGWSFPSLTDANVAAFKSFLDNGGNMLIAGQDIGWETSAAGYYTAETLDFYENYMHASFVDDGDGSRTSLESNSADPYFGGVGQIQIEDVYNGNYYPDAINPVGGAISILTYNDEQTGAINFNGDTFKTVYLGVGLEMLGSSEAKNAFMEAVHTFFYEGVEDDPTEDPVPDNPTAVHIIDGLGTIQLLPNPASDFVNLTLTELDEDLTISFFDLNGKLMLTKNIDRGTNELNISVQSWTPGNYFYQLNNNKTSIASGKLIVK